MTDLERLAERVEALTGPCRETDRAIMEALALKPDYAADWGSRENCRPAAFAYTASLDAAMTLVPEGWHVSNVGTYGFGMGDFIGKAAATVLPLDCAGLADATFEQRVAAMARCNSAATMPLALTAACLRAIAREQDQ